MTPARLTDVNNAFLNGLVFGFDVGTGSIGYAVRRGKEFLKVGVIICPEGTSDLKKRRELRRQRRTLRSKKRRRQWLAQELVKLDLTRPSANLQDPVILRARAVSGAALTPEELRTAIAHLWRRRGYLERVPWSSREEGDDRKKEEGVVRDGISKLRTEMKDEGCMYPCHFLIRHPQDQRRRVWPRNLLEAEFRAIVAAQRDRYPKLAEKADWLLYGDTRPIKGEHVYFKSTDGHNPGVLGLRWPRFDNRGPALDSWQPLDADGRPLHVVRKNKDSFKCTQWELALMNFRVLDAQTRQKRDPRVDFPDFVATLRKEWDKKAAKSKSFKIDLKKLAKPYADKFLLVEDQKPLTPDGGGGRARYSTPTLELLRKEIGSGRRVDPPQPVLQRGKETSDRALDRYLADIKHPLVRHRLGLLRRLLNQLIAKHGQPDLIVVEAVRSLALSQKNKNELNKRNEEFRKEREIARGTLKASGQSITANAIQKYRLWQEAKGRCPFCLEAISQTALFSGETDIEHLVPRARVDCNELYNLTVGHIHCNRNVKGDHTPFDAFSASPKWQAMQSNAAECFKGRKLEIFLSPNAEELIEQKADLVQTSYIAKVLRHLCLLRLGWLGADGRDPTDIKNTPSQRFQVTNGQITSRLRQSWGLNNVLYAKPAEDNEEAWKQFSEKNRGDLRHHALDAMVISCTLPWLAHLTHGAKDLLGNSGWWRQDEKGRSLASNPIKLDYEKAKTVIEKVLVRHHVSRSNHQQAYATTLYAKKDKDTYVAREVFTTLTPKNLGSIYPETFSAYCQAAWDKYKAEADDIDAELKKTKGSVPGSFTNKLCFAHFQQWRAKGAPEFTWPKEVKIPIRNVRLISIKDHTAVMPFSKGTHAYVKRSGFREVRIHVGEDGKTLIPVFVPYWRGDPPFSNKPIASKSKPVAVIRRGDVVTLRKPLAAGAPAGRYRITSTKQEELRLIPAHLRDDEDTLIAFGLKRTGARPRWPEFLRAIGYELPHSSSTEPESSSAAEA
jgi:hypothetical protein